MVDWRGDIAGAYSLLSRLVYIFWILKFFAVVCDRGFELWNTRLNFILNYFSFKCIVTSEQKKLFLIFFEAFVKMKEIL